MGILNQMADLARAGFTKADILKLMQTESPATATNPAPVTAPTPAAPVTAHVGVTGPTGEPGPQGAPDILAEMRKMIGEMQAANIQQTQQPKEITVDDVIAQIINPTTTQEGDKK